MAADADPTFEVATIKPSDPAAKGKGFGGPPGHFQTRNTTLNDLIMFSFVSLVPRNGMSMSSDRRETIPMKNFAQHLIAEVPTLAGRAERRRLEFLAVILGPALPTE
jgi:hypothetical protein